MDKHTSIIAFIFVGECLAVLFAGAALLSNSASYCFAWALLAIALPIFFWSYAHHRHQKNPPFSIVLMAIPMVFAGLILVFLFVSLLK